MKRQSTDFIDEVGTWVPLAWTPQRDAIDGLVAARLDHAVDRLRSVAESDIRDEEGSLMARGATFGGDSAGGLSVAMQAARIAFMESRRFLKKPDLATCPACASPTGLRPSVTPGYVQIACRKCGRVNRYVDLLRGRLR